MLNLSGGHYIKAQITMLLRVLGTNVNMTKQLHSCIIQMIESTHLPPIRLVTYMQTITAYNHTELE